MYGFSCSRCLSGAWFRKECARVCHHEEDCAGNSGVVFVELSVSAVRACLRAGCRGVCACDRSGAGAIADFPQAEQGTGGC